MKGFACDYCMVVANPEIMGEFIVGRRYTLLGWLANGVMALQSRRCSSRCCGVLGAE
jgi:hypothetical protein